MFYDRFSVFSTSQEVDGSGGAAYNEISTDVMDLGATPTLRSLSFEGMHLHVVLTAITVDAAQDTTVNVSLESDSVVGLTSATVHYKTGELSVDDLTAGDVIAVVPLPAKADYQRYMGVRYTITNPNSAGAVLTFDARLVAVPNINPAYPDAT